MQRLIQFVLRGRDELSPAAQQSTEALEGLRTTAANLNRQLDDAKGARGLVTALGTTERAIAQTQTSVQRVDRTIADLREALDRNPDLNPPYGGFFIVRRFLWRAQCSA
ncbi:hypothetical protein [Pseudomonas aeruginosa]